MGKLYELLKSGEVPAPSFGLDFERMGTNKIADTMVRGKYSRNSDKWTVNRHGILVKAEEDRISLDLKDGKVGYLAEDGATNQIHNSRDIREDFGFSRDGATLIESGDLIKMKNNGETNGRVGVGTDRIVGSTNELSVRYFIVEKVNTPILIMRSSGAVTGQYIEAKFNIDTNTVISQGSASGGAAIFGAGIRDFGNYKLIFTVGESGGNASQESRMSLFFGDSGGSTNGNQTLNGDEEVLIYGAQYVIDQNVVSSFIETPSGSTASRGADNLIFENAEELIGQESGVVLFSINSIELFDTGVPVILGTTDNGLRIIRASGNSQIAVTYRIGSSSAFTIFEGNLIEGKNNFMVSYTPSEVKLFRNGEIRATESHSETLPSMDKICIGNNQEGGQTFNSHIFKAYLWNTGDWLTDSLAEQLTDNNS